MGISGGGKFVNPGDGFIGANEIHIPVGKKIMLQLQAADVIHSFWVPRLAGKMDCIPGRDNYLWLQANGAGKYEGVCAEFCGSQHAWMKLTVFAHPQDEYEQWLQAQRNLPRKPDSTDEQLGEKLFFAATCANCHAIQGTTAKATIGPDLTHLASRAQLGGGVANNSAEVLF